MLADLAGRLASEWGLISCNYKNGIEWVLAQMGSIRRTVAENKNDAFDLLGEYLNETASSALTVFHQGEQKPTLDYSRPAPLRYPRSVRSLPQDRRGSLRPRYCHA